MAYRVITLDQKSDEWKAWRKEGIGASDAPIILGLSPYMKPRKLWEIKMGLAPEQTMNSFVEERAQKVENAARAALEIELGLNFPAICAEDADRPFLKVSLDGFCAESEMGPLAMEAKYVGAGKVVGKIPAHHWVQMQYQAAIMGLKDIIYVRSCDGINFSKMVVARDQRYIDMMLSEVVQFWDSIKANKAPEDVRRKAGWKEEFEESINDKM